MNHSNKCVEGYKKDGLMKSKGMEAKCRGRSDSLVSLGNGKEGTNMYVSIKVDSLVTTATYKYSIKCAINLHLNGFFKLECFCRLACLASVVMPRELDPIRRRTTGIF